MIEEEILKAKCGNCENAYREYGKLCPWRSLSGDYCFDGMTAEEAHREIKKHFDDFQIEIARGLAGKWTEFRYGTAKANKARTVAGTEIERNARSPSEI